MPVLAGGGEISFMCSFMISFCGGGEICFGCLFGGDGHLGICG